MNKIFFILLLLTSITVPAQPIEIIVPFTPGGAVDLIARKFAIHIAEKTFNPVIINNIPGANGYIGIRKLQGSLDRTIIITNSSFYENIVDHNVSLNKFKFVSIIGEMPMVLMVTKSSGATCQSLKNNKTYFVGTVGAGASSIPVAFLQEKYKNFVEIPYKGKSQAVVDLVGGHIDLVFIMGFVLQNDNLVALSTTYDKTLRGIPTLHECLGINKTIKSQVLVIANDSATAEFINQLNDLSIEFTQTPEVIDYFEDNGIIKKSSSITNTNVLVQEEANYWNKILKSKKTPHD